MLCPLKIQLYQECDLFSARYPHNNFQRASDIITVIIEIMYTRRVFLVLNLLVAQVPVDH